MRALLAAILVCVVIAACELRSYSDPVVLSGDNPTDSPQPRDFVAELIDGESPNQFKVKLSWKEVKFASGFALLRSAKGENDKELNVEGSEREFIDENVEAGATYRYKLMMKKNMQWADSRFARIEIPKDLELKPQGPQIVPGKYHRVFFRKGTRLHTTTDLIVNADEFIIEPDFEIHYWIEGAGVTIPINYEIALVTKRVKGNEKILLVNHFEDMLFSTWPAMLLESAEGMPFDFEDRNTKNSRFCVAVPELKVWGEKCDKVAEKLRAHGG